MLYTFSACTRVLTLPGKSWKNTVESNSFPHSWNGKCRDHNVNKYLNSEQLSSTFCFMLNFLQWTTLWILEANAVLFLHSQALNRSCKIFNGLESPVKKDFLLVKEWEPWCTVFTMPLSSCWSVRAELSWRDLVQLPLPDRNLWPCEASLSLAFWMSLTSSDCYFLAFIYQE